MCTNCTTASQHFSDGSKPSGRPLATSVDQGTSPDWKASSGPAATPGAKRADQLLDQFDDPDYIGNF